MPNQEIRDPEYRVISPIRTILNLLRPVQLLLALLAYWLGVGLARYLGATIMPEPQIFGALLVVLLLASSNLLSEYFRPFNEPLIVGEIREERELLRSRLMVLTIGLLAVATLLIYLLQRSSYLETDSTIILALFSLLALANAIPPVRLANRGLGELSSAIQIGSLVPTLAFLFQYGSLQRLLTIFSVPLFLLTLSYFLAQDFPSYADDLKYERRTFLMALTWERAIPLHNLLILCAYLFLAASPFMGVPVALVWPAMLTLPLAGYQVFILRGLADGAKPIWPVFVATSTAILALTSYLIALSLWLR